MKKIASFLTTCVVLLLAYSCGEDSRRDPGEHHGREEGSQQPVLPDGSHLTAADMKELGDTLVRFSGNGVLLSYGTPGVLLVVDDEAFTLRDLAEGGHSAEFSYKTRRIALDGMEIGHDAVKIGEDRDRQWWRATIEGNRAIYFVISIN